MARKPAKRPKTYRRSPVTMKDWSPSFVPIFRLVSESWTPPKQVRVTHTQRGFTVVAKFVTDNDQVATCRVVLRRYADGSLGIGEETLSFRFYLTSKGKG